jgi:hypothetical protein
MAVDPSISLAAQSPQIDLASIYGAAMQLRNMQQQMAQQNALRAILTQRAQSEVQTEQRKRDLDFLSGAVADYDGDVKGGVTDPTIAFDKLKTGVRDYVYENYPETQADQIWKHYSSLDATGYRNAALTAQQRFEQQKLSEEQEFKEKELGEERVPATMGGKPVSVDKAGNVYDPNTGAKLQVTAPVEREATKLDPVREAIEREALTERERHDAAAERFTEQRLKETASFTPEMGSLMAAMAEEGVSLPSGFRSKAQQAMLYQGLLERNPDKSPDEIAKLIKTGQIEFGAQRKETQTAAGVAGKVEVAQNEITNFIPLVEEAAKAVPRSSFMPVNKLVQSADAQLSDPNLKALKIRINSLLNAYDMLASRGGTDKDKRSEVRSLLTSADSPQALEAGLKSFALEAEAAHKAAVSATRVPELEGETSAPPKRSGDNPPIAGARKAPDGQWYVQKNGKTFRVD